MYGCSEYSTNSQTATVQIPAPVTTPTNFSVLGSGAVGQPYKFRWGVVSGASHYNLKEQNYTCSQNADIVTTIPANLAQPYSVIGRLTICGGQERDPTKYIYSLQACNGAACSGWTPTVMVTVSQIPLRPLAPTTTYIHTDGLRSPVAETNATGAVTSRMRYEPYGAPTTGTQAQGPGYTGHVWDAATGLSYMQQRYYDPIAGPFLSTDPVAASAAGFNRYWYANNNPYKYIDLDGRISSLKDHSSLRSGVKTFTINDDSGGGDEGGDVKDITECRTAGCTNPALVGAAKKTAEVASEVADAVDEQVTDPTNYLAGPALKGIGLGVKAGVGALVFKTTKDAAIAAEKLGFKRINETIKGQAIFSDGKRFITRDIDGHNGGAWKMANSVKNLGAKETRTGTFDANLSKIGD